MKRTKLLVVSLISLLGLAGCGNKPAPQPADETIHVEKVDLNKTAIKLQVGGHVTLTATISPSNATVKDVTYSSDKPTIATVSDQGEVEARAVGTAVITVTTQDGQKTASCTIQVLEHFEDLEIDSLAAPKFVSDFAANTATLDKVSNIQANPNPKKNQYYENELGGVDTYKVGNVNPFKFETTAVAFDAAEVESHINHPVTSVELYEKGASDYQKVENLSTYVTVNANHNEFQFNDDAVGKQFKLKLSIDSSAYSSVSTTCKPVEFEFEVFDGYNVYSKEELSLFDNRSIHPTEIGDPWASYKDANETLKAYKNEDIHGLALHANMNILNEDVPASMKWTKADVDQYAVNFPNSIEQWIDRVNTSDPNVTVTRENLEDSLKDFSTIYYRVTNNDEFKFEGNYFTIDASKVKQVTFFVNSMTNGHLHFYGGDSMTSVPDGSHAQMFGFNCQNEDSDQAENVARGGENTLKNVTLIGNGKNVNSELYLGGMIMYKVDATSLTVQNIISSDTFITFLTRSNPDYLGTHLPRPASDSEEDVAAFEELQPGETSLRVDRYKCFDSYNSMFYVWGTRKNYITNSFMKGAGGPLFILDDVNAHKMGADAGLPDEQMHMFGFAPAVESTNVYFENWITGLEPWFATKTGADALATQLAAAGSLDGAIGGTAAGIYMNDQVPADYKAMLTTTTKAGAEDSSVLFFNLIAIDICGADFTGNNADGKGSNLRGKFIVHNTLDEAAPNEYAMEMQSLVATSATPTEWTAEQLFKQIYMLGKDVGMIFKSQNGGTIMLGKDDAMFFNTYDKLVYALQNTATNQGLCDFINGQLKEAMGDAAYSYLYPNDLFQKSKIQDAYIMDGSTPVPTGLLTMLSLVSGNYMSTFIKPAEGTVEFMGAVLGTTPLLESGLLPQA